MMIYWLLIIFFALTLLSFTTLKTDIVNPGFVVPFVFFVSTCCAIYNQSYWEFEIGEETFAILVSGVVLYVVVSLIAYKLGLLITIRTNREPRYEIYNTLEPIVVGIPKVILLTGFQFVSTVLYYREVMRVVSSNGGSTISLALTLSSYKLLTHFQNIDDEVTGLVSQMYQLTSIIGLVFTYIVIYNFVAQKKVRKINLVPIVVYIISIVLSGNRLSIIRLALVVLVLYFILWHRKNGWHRKIKMLTLLKTMLLLVAVLALFVGLRTVIGKSDSDKDPLYYLTSYAGGSIPLFDLFVKDPISKSVIFGKETLYYINQFIGSKFGIDSLDYSFAAEFRRIRGITLGNVYTAFRAYYYDFGYAGMLLCTALHSFFFSTLYALIRKRSSRKEHLGIDIPLCLFLRVSYSYFLFSINNYTDWLSPNFIKLIVFYCVIVWFVEMNFSEGLKIRSKRKNNTSKRK